MRRHPLTTLLLGSLLLSGACTAGDEGEEGEPITGKADQAGLPYGLYQNWDWDYTDGDPLLLALWEDLDVPDGYAGRYDLVRSVEDPGTLHTTGLFRLYRYQGKTKIRFETDEGDLDRRYYWSYEDQELRLDDGRVGLGILGGRSVPEGTLSVTCLAVDVLYDLFEEGLSPQEYPEADAEIGPDGTARVDLGAMAYETEEGDEIVADVADDGRVAVSVQQADGIALKMAIPAGVPRRGAVEVDEGDGFRPLAETICLPPQLPAADR